MVQATCKPKDCFNLIPSQDKGGMPSVSEGAPIMAGKCPFLESLSPNAKVIPLGPDSSFVPLVVIKKMKCPKDSTAKSAAAPAANVGKCTAGGGSDDELGSELHESSSRELRAGILYHGCDCEKRNGLQDQCPRLQCRGSPRCLTNPPTCPPSEFSNAKHLTAKMKPRRQ